MPFARAKMRRKKMDLCVANAPAAMGAERSTAILLTPDGGRTELRRRSKRDIARAILDRIERVFA